MNVILRPVNLDEKLVLGNLLEKYNYEFSQYDMRDVNKLGLYGYNYLDNYWTEGKRWAYFIEADGNLAGFAMINDYTEDKPKRTDFVMAEFFVMYKYRRMGVGKQAFFKALELHKGTWQLMRHPKNIPSVHFWNNAVNEYTKGKFELIEGCLEIRYDDGTPADILLFETMRGE